MTQNKLVAQQIKPLSASMTGSVWDGDQVHFNMQIEVAEFTFRDSTHPGPVMLESIDFGVMDWKELANREFTFPRNPEDGYVDGGLALLWEWIPADLLKIVFGDAGTSSIPATLTIDFDVAVHSSGAEQGQARRGECDISSAWTVRASHGRAAS